jgi:hypothetical protein
MKGFVPTTTVSGAPLSPETRGAAVDSCHERAATSERALHAGTRGREEVEGSPVCRGGF